MGCEPKYAIRDVSEKTGVKPVTLRAWQRRYGLVQPERTEKGHRLYSDADIELIKTIQSWLEKGVSIGKVKELLNSDSSPVFEQQDEAPQLAEVESVLAAIAKLQYTKSEQILSGIFKEYPSHIVIEQAIKPILTTLEVVKNSQKSLQLGLFNSVVTSVVGKIVDAENKAGKKNKLLMVSFDAFGSIHARMELVQKVEQGNRVVLIESVEDLGGLKDMLATELYTAVYFYASQDIPAKLVSNIKELKQQVNCELEACELLTTLHFN
ncbi:MerR family transcriptional regulator [Vibrio sp. SCSIO 43136]|uniref:MerR family transcriptional regulator n=1 Tax=Vibrio sp. SCSIO 43136 TaxID=2819101 RepID=UPI0020750B07|nr:MerR family transcriptional regulator [Vibrio sp. SCSIO 43136]USD67915.1 MerR family transcriptional regulator [Vibrio sp. SCSIO 43136]